MFRGVRGSKEGLEKLHFTPFHDIYMIFSAQLFVFIKRKSFHPYVICSNYELLVNFLCVALLRLPYTQEQYWPQLCNLWPALSFESRLPGFVFLLNTTDNAPRSTPCSDYILVSYRQEIPLLHRQFFRLPWLHPSYGWPFLQKRKKRCIVLILGITTLRYRKYL